MSDYHFRPFAAHGSAEKAQARLEAILADKVLRFNPYLVDDEALLACAERGRWRQFPALTQMVIFHFLDIRPVRTHHDFDAIFYRIGNSAQEFYFPLGDLIYSIAHHTSKMPERTQTDGRNITRSSVAGLQNRSFFVSHAIPGCRTFAPTMLAYKMFRLKGSAAEQADMIRRQMCRSKVAMLEEVLNHPASPFYLGYSDPYLDFITPIRAALRTVAQYPDALNAQIK